MKIHEFQAKEILRHLADHKVTVVWMFDESGSMKDDQQAVKEKFDHVASALKENVTEEQKAQDALTHVIVGFGDNTHLELPKPTPDVDAIGRAARCEWCLGIDGTCERDAECGETRYSLVHGPPPGPATKASVASSCPSRESCRTPRESPAPRRSAPSSRLRCSRAIAWP